MRCLSTEKSVIKLISQCNLENKSIVGVTVSARDHSGADFTNSFVTDLTEAMYETLKNTSKLKRYVYGEQQRMATVLMWTNI